LNQQGSFGVATLNEEARLAASKGIIDFQMPKFSHQLGVLNGGVLAALPALISQGLLEFLQVYTRFPQGYYGQMSILLSLAFMALSRIENPEQLKQYKPGELGQLLGLDRIPEMRCLREKVKFLVEEKKVKEMSQVLLKRWLLQQDHDHDHDDCFLYIDGHVIVYHGSEARLPLKYVARQKLCLNATTEYWVNNEEGLPLLVITGELTEKLTQAIKDKIIPQLLDNDYIKQRITENVAVLCTFVFDREAYEPGFFNWLWITYKIAVITYRKYVNDLWDITNFKEIDIQVINHKIPMLLCDKKITLQGYDFREVRKSSEQGHQTAIITTHPTLSIDLIASKMFSRWTQENFFKYLKSDFQLDKFWQYESEKANPNFLVTNPEYKKISNQIKTKKQKKNQLILKKDTKVDTMSKQKIEDLKHPNNAYTKLLEDIKQLQKEIDELYQTRKKIAPKIKLSELPEHLQYTQLKTEHKEFINLIKMVAYRAETALVQYLKPFYKDVLNDGRMLIKNLFTTPADIVPNYQNNTLTVKIAGMANPNQKKNIQLLFDELNLTETIFPNTNLMMKYEFYQP
jgi:hypothetical protein